MIQHPAIWCVNPKTRQAGPRLRSLLDMLKFNAVAFTRAMANMVHKETLISGEPSQDDIKAFKVSMAGVVEACRALPISQPVQNQLQRLLTGSTRSASTQRQSASHCRASKLGNIASCD